MDTSKKYIEMCSKATEIQELKNNIDLQNGDVFYVIPKFVTSIDTVRKYKAYQDVNVGDEWFPGGEFELKCKCVGFDEDIQKLDIECKSKPEKNQIFIYSENSNKYIEDDCICYDYPSDGQCGFFEIDKVWLPRQDQLQEMVTTKLWRLVRNISDFHIKNYAFLSEATMEQLWLAFVMKTKYQKTWDKNKKEWINE